MLLLLPLGHISNSNMLHYSNASSIEKSRRYLMIKGGLAWLLWQEGGGRQLYSRTGQQQRRSRSLPGRRGGRTVNAMQT